MSEPVQPDFTVDSTDYEVGQDNVQVMGLDIHNPVFMISAVTVVAFVIFTLMFQEGTGVFFGWLRPWLTSTFDWVFMSAANIFVLFCFFLVLSPWGRIRLGGADATPDYSYTGWFAMLFAAGMGIGLMFFGVLEPVYHFQNPPLGVNPEDVEAARAMGMAATIFHWGLHPWAIYAVVALALAFFTFNNGLPLTIRSAFYPLLGDRVWGWPGHIIDTLAVFATLFGLVALVSVVDGLEAGVKRLSEINMALALALLLFVIIAGPTVGVLTGFFANAGHYFGNVLSLSNFVGREDTDFMHGWTTFYWAWWISWSPFVGMFIARVSRGRTVREFITCVLIIPTLVSILWMTAFGGTAIEQIVDDNYQGVAETVAAYVPELSLFKMLEVLPLTMVSSLIGIVLVIVFFVTSSDSGSLVIDTITAGGKTDAPVVQRVFWATFEGLVAITLLLGGGLASLQAAAIATGFPFAIVLVVMCWCLFKGLRADPQMLR